jgi:DNA-binding NarL/FixJ family response regulator
MELVKVILADDHALIRAGLRDALAHLPGLQIIDEVSNGPDLIQSLDRHTPDLLLVDVNMPDFEPIRAIQQIRSEYPDLKILVVSAYDDQAYVIGLLSAGVNGYHLKDQPLADLQLAVRRVLDGGRWISDPLLDRLVDHKTASSSSLTRRQRELLYLLSQGYNNQKIALAMEISIKTVENHLTALYRAIGVEGRLGAYNYASRHPELILMPALDNTQLKAEATLFDTLSVLLVDDNPRYRTQLSKLIRRILPASSIYESEEVVTALKLAERIKPKLAFIDVVLRDEDGIRCARGIKAVSPATRMILISAYPDREFRRMGLGAGAVAFLDKKDIDSETVKQLLEDILGATTSLN